MRIPNFDVNELIAYLQGTCNSLSDGVDAISEEYKEKNPDFEGMTEDDLTGEDHDEIDSQIFVCDTCNWWCELSEQSENGSDCEDCNPSENEDEDFDER